jgi:hypothetical protein
MHRKLWISFGFGLWITGVGWENRGKKNEKGVGGPFPGVHRQLRMILIQQSILKTSTHLTITNASPKASEGPTSHHHHEPVG